MPTRTEISRELRDALRRADVLGRLTARDVDTLTEQLVEPTARLLALGSGYPLRNIAERGAFLAIYGRGPADPSDPLAECREIDARLADLEDAGARAERLAATGFDGLEPAPRRAARG